MLSRFLGRRLVVLAIVFATVSLPIDPSPGGVTPAGPRPAFDDPLSEETSTTPLTETITTGRRVSGAFPAAIEADDDMFINYQEGDDPTRAEIGYRSNTGTNTVSSPKTRSWDGSTWGAEAEQATAGSPIRAVRIAWSYTSPGTRIIVTQSDDGFLDAYVCTPSCTVTNNIGQTWTTPPSADRKLFDVTYEQASGDALLVYSVVSNDTTRDLAYQTYVGGSWSGEQYLDDTGKVTDVEYGALKVASRAGSDQIGLVAKDNTNDDVNAWIWDGAVFGNFVELTASGASGSSFEPVAVAWESNSGHLIAVSRENVTDTIVSKEFTTAWSGVSSGTCGVTSAYFMSLRPNPVGDDMVMVAATNASADLGTCRWTGSAWANPMTHDSDTDGVSSRPADFAWEDAGSKGLLVWGTTAGQITYRTFTATNTWGTITNVPMGGVSDTHPWVQLRTNPTTQAGSMKILGAVMDTANNLGGVRWDGTTFTVVSTSTFTGDVGTASWESFELEYQAKADDGLFVQYNWTGVPAGGSHTLRVKGYRDTENFAVQVFTPPATWTTRITISATTSTSYAYTLTPAEYNGGAPSVRFNDTSVDGLQSNLYLDLSVSAGTAAIEILVLQPDGTDGKDTFLLDVPLWWNFGTNASLFVGRNASTGSIARSLLQFDLSALPPGATIVNASLELFSDVGSSGTIDAYRIGGTWSEGAGDRAWRRVRVTVRETAGLSRTLEPVAALLPFSPYDIGDPARDLRVWAGPQETPSQVYSFAVAGGHVVQATTHLGATVGPNEFKEFYVTYSTNETAVPGYRTRVFGTSPRWLSPPVGLGASSPTIVDLDGDGSLEILYGTQDGFVRVLDASGSPRWSVNLIGDPVPFPPQVRDFDGDGSLDVVAVTSGGTLIRMNNSGGVQWTTTIGGGTYSPPALLDVDADGVLDALIGTSNAVQAFSLGTGTYIRSYSASGTSTGAPSVADLDGDGNAEIVFGAVDSNVHVFEPAGLERYIGAAPGSGQIRNTVAIGDLDGDGLPEIVTGDDASGGLEFSWNPRTNTSAWSVPLPDRRRGHQTLADIDGDGALDVVVGVSSGEVFALDGRNGTTLWSRVVGSTQALAPAVADLDRDGRPEFVCVTELGSLVQVLNSTGNPIHTWAITPNDPGEVSAQPESTTPTIADVDGDGTLDVIVPTGSGIAVFGTGGLSADWRTLGYNWNHTHRKGDGASPDGAPPLNVTVGGAQPFPALGASWILSDGVQPWVVWGGDYVGLEDSVPAGAGWHAWNVTSAVTDWYQGAYPNTGLLLYDPSESTGELHAFHSSDSASPNLRPILRIAYAPAFVDPTPRIVGPVQDFARPEDSAPWSTSLSGLADDEDTPLASLQWNVSGYDPAVLQITGINTPGNHVLTFYPQPDAWGSMRVTYWLSDPEGNAAWRDAWINVTPVNDAPRFDPPASLVVKYDLEYVFDFAPYIADVDDPPSSLTLVSDDPTHTNVTGFNVSFLFPVSYLDQWAFVGLIVSDGRASVGKVVAVKVTRDDPPVLTQTLPDVTMQEGETIIGVFDLDGYFTDPNNDTLFFSYGYSHLTIIIHANHTVDIAAESNWFGAEGVTFRGTDPEGALAEDTILVTVIPVNDPPILGPVPDLRVRYDANYSFDLEPYLSDADTPIEALVVTTSSTYVTVLGRSLTLLYPFALNDTVQNLTIRASDGTSTASRTIRVTVGDDWPPVLARKLGDRTLLEDGTILGAYDLRTFFSDPDGETLYFSSGNVNVLVSIDPLGVVSLSAVRDWFGAERVTFRARDALGALAEDNVWIAVLPVNDAPSFRSIPTVYLNTTSGVLDLTPYLVDVDTNVSDLVLTSSSANVTVVGRSLIFHYRSDADERLNIVVSDGFLEGGAFVEIVVRLPRTTERLPPILWWLLAIGAVATAVGVAFWRYRRVEWVFLVTNGGLLLASVFRRGSESVDSDLMAGMMTAILDFAKVSFSDEKSRELDEFSLGDRRVELVRGKHGYLAAIYTGRTPGRLEHIMKSLLNHIEERHPGAFGSVVDTSEFQEIPVLMKRLMDRGWWPFLSFPTAKQSRAPRE